MAAAAAAGGAGATGGEGFSFFGAAIFSLMVVEGFPSFFSVGGGGAEGPAPPDWAARLALRAAMAFNRAASGWGVSSGHNMRDLISCRGKMHIKSCKEQVRRWGNVVSHHELPVFVDSQPSPPACGVGTVRADQGKLPIFLLFKRKGKFTWAFLARRRAYLRSKAFSASVDRALMRFKSVGTCALAWAVTLRFCVLLGVDNIISKHL